MAHSDGATVAARRQRSGRTLLGRGKPRDLTGFKTARYAASPTARIQGKYLVVEAVEGSDYWEKTLYGFQHDSGHALLAHWEDSEAIEVSFTPRPSSAKPRSSSNAFSVDGASKLVAPNQKPSVRTAWPPRPSFAKSTSATKPPRHQCDHSHDNVSAHRDPHGEPELPGHGVRPDAERGFPNEPPHVHAVGPVAGGVEVSHASSLPRTPPRSRPAKRVSALADTVTQMLL